MRVPDYCEPSMPQKLAVLSKFQGNARYKWETDKIIEKCFSSAQVNFKVMREDVSQVL